MKNNISSYIKKRNKLIENKNLTFFGSINVFIKDNFLEDINLKSVLNKIENLLPAYYVNNIDALYVGQFKDFLEKDTNAAYKNGALYITNDQDDEEDMVDDIIHEIAHAFFWDKKEFEIKKFADALCRFLYNYNKWRKLKE